MTTSPYSTYLYSIGSNTTSFTQFTNTTGSVHFTTLSFALSSAIALWNSVTYWVAAIVCPVLLVVGVPGNLYASLVLIFLRRVQKNPAILTIIVIGMHGQPFICQFTVSEVIVSQIGRFRKTKISLYSLRRFYILLFAFF